MVKSSDDFEMAAFGEPHVVHLLSMLRVFLAFLGTDLVGLRPDKGVNLCAKCFFWLRQPRRVRRSLDVESVKTLVHAFVTTRLDYCNSVL